MLIEKEIQFITFRKMPVWGMVISFESKNQIIDNILKDWGYTLDVPEDVSLLWPPAYEKGEKLAVSSSNLYLYSSFKIQGHGNINVADNCISKISGNITKIYLHDSIHILKKNAELEILKEPLPSAILSSKVKVEQADSFCVPNANTFFLYSELGTNKLEEGQKVFLTSDTFVAEYVGNTMTRIIRFPEPVKPTIDEKFFEIISNYWITKEYQTMPLDSLPPSICDYLDRCRRNNHINIAVEQLIAEAKDG